MGRAMRRTTPGVLGGGDLVEAADPARRGGRPRAGHRDARAARHRGPAPRLREVLARRLCQRRRRLRPAVRPPQRRRRRALVRGLRRPAAPRRRAPGTRPSPWPTRSRAAPQKWIDVTRHASPATVVAWARAADMPLVGGPPRRGAPRRRTSAPMPRVGLVLGNEREGIHADLAARLQRPGAGPDARVRREPQRQRDRRHPPSRGDAGARRRPRRSRPPPPLRARSLPFGARTRPTSSGVDRSALRWHRRPP